MEPFAGMSHEDLLKLVLSFSILLGTARLFGGLVKRVGLPSVVGELLAGVVLGPSLLSALFPELGRWIVPGTEIQSQLLEVVGLFGVMFLLMVVGLETDLSLIRSRARVATAVGLSGLVVPFVAGLGVSLVFPDDLLVNPERRRVFALFLAVALALSAIPVLAKILADMGLIRTPFGQSTLAAGMIDDILGWTLLGVVTSLAAAGGVNAGNVIQTLVAVVVFLAATLFVARPLARIGLRVIQERSRSRDATLTLLVVGCFIWGAFSHALHLEPVLGAFAMAVVFGQIRRLPPEVGRSLESITFGVFAPVFLAIAGLRLSLETLGRPSLVALTVILLIVAAASKLVGAYIGARYLARTDVREAIGYGVALNARGVLGIIVASLGLSMGILGVEVYSMIVLVSVATSLMAPIGLRLVFGAAETRTDKTVSPLGRVDRVLIAIRPGQGAGALESEYTRSLEASVLTSLGLQSANVTLFSVAERSARSSAQEQLASLARLFPRHTDVTGRVGEGDPATAILEEAEKGYDLIAMGAPARQDHDHLFGSVVDTVVRLAPCPSLVFTARRGQWPPKSILVPTGGGHAASRAADLAFSLAGGDSEVVLYHVVDPELSTEMSGARTTAVATRLNIAHGIVNELREAGDRAGVRTATEIAMGGSMVDNVLARAAQDIDLIVIGTGLRVGSPRLFLGPRVERLLLESACSVVVLNT
ncbi:MAG TPA: cation:proton antiporter [Acidimicrobiia bacterium]